MPERLIVPEITLANSIVRKRPQIFDIMYRTIAPYFPYKLNNYVFCLRIHIHMSPSYASVSGRQSKIKMAVRRFPGFLSKHPGPGPLCECSLCSCLSHIALFSASIQCIYSTPFSEYFPIFCACAFSREADWAWRIFDNEM